MILALLIESHLGNISVKSESHQPKGLGGDNNFKANYSRYSFFGSGSLLVYQNYHLAIQVEGHLSNIPYKFE